MYPETMIRKINALGRKWLILFMIIPFTIISWGFVDDYFQYGKQLEIFASVYREVNQYYVDEVNPGELMKTGINGMLNNLDPYTNYYPESEIEDYRMKHVSTEYGGIGASSFRIGDSVVVYDVYEGFPAQKADLRTGDVILSVNSRPLKGLSPEEVDEMIKGQSGTPIKLTIIRNGDTQPIEKTIIREDVKVKNVSYFGMINDSTGYIKLDKFLQNCFNEVHDALVELKKNPKMNALVFDLRGNGGGLLEESVQILNLFINKGQLLVTQKGRIEGSNAIYVSKSDPVDANIRVAVLVDKMSASASEITAGNFQDVDRGVIIGQRSYGKGLVQQTRPLSFNSQLKVTVAKYTTASGRCVQTKIYSHRLDEGVIEIADSVAKEFKTKNGRTVYDASAVYPDRYIAPMDTSNIARSLYRNLLIFEYASEFRNKKSTIDSAATYHFTDADYKEFIRFLDTKEYDYSTQTEASYAELKDIVIKDKYYASVGKELDHLGGILKHNKSEDLLSFKDEIKGMLEKEIVNRYYFATGKYKYMFTHDPIVKEALTVLGDPVLYTSILQGEGKYKVIGKPGDRK
ncbi:S41 family peptidase [soil metagenome]